jgi:hypothetical protein
MSSRAERSPRFYATLGWGAIVVSTVAWAAHLLFSAAWVEAGGRSRSAASGACAYGATWPLHLATVVTAAACLVALGAALVVLRHRDDAESGSGTLEGQLRFLGLVGVAAALVNLLLIVVEGSYVFFLRSCG